MPLRFYVKPDLPADVNTVTLNYAFYNGSQSINAAALKQVGSDQEFSKILN